MLARTPNTLVYLSAAELGITERERAGLIEVRDDLASGRVKHARLISMEDADNRDPFAPVFNMEFWQGRSDCGTCQCIGGFMAARGVFDCPSLGDLDYDASPALDRLFYPNDYADIEDRNDLTPAQAVRAIDHFLAGAGAECWPMALQDIPAA